MKIKSSKRTVEQRNRRAQRLSAKSLKMERILRRRSAEVLDRSLGESASQEAITKLYQAPTTCYDTLRASLLPSTLANVEDSSTENARDIVNSDSQVNPIAGELSVSQCMLNTDDLDVKIATNLSTLLHSPLSQSISPRHTNQISHLCNLFISPTRGIRTSVTEIIRDKILSHITSDRKTKEHGNALRRSDDEAVVEDSGYTNCTVLVLLPMRSTAHHFLCDLLHEYDTIVHRDKFEAEFGTSIESDPSRGPTDHRDTFHGNIDDKFCLGVTLGPHKATLYSKYVHCNLLVASPLGIAHYLGISGEEGYEKRGTDSSEDSASSSLSDASSGESSEEERDDDNDETLPGDKSYVLSSIELLFVPCLEVLMMQNWQRVLDVTRAINRPVAMRSTEALGDFSRLKPCFRDGTARHLRQNICLAQFSHPYFNALWRELCRDSVLPSHQIHQEQELPPALQDVRAPSELRQYFIRIEERTPQSAHADRARYFREKFYPTKLSHFVNSATPVLLVAADYFHYVSLRCFLEENAQESYAELCEYTPERDRRSALRDFGAGTVSILLTTERFYFYRRYFVRGVSVVVWYGPPLFSHFYPEIVNKLDRRNPSVCVMTLFSKYDAHSLTRLLGEKRARAFLDQKESSVFLIHA